jgi:hypothetical protein
MESQQGSIRGHPLTGSSLMGSQQGSIEGHPLTGSSLLGSQQGSVIRNPGTGSSLMGSDLQALDQHDPSMSMESAQVRPTRVYPTIEPPPPFPLSPLSLLCV